ncbi:PIG-L family deacetylase [Candidatus Dojkabacteria bacterium]|uniref:PIG-L family deacetylase n=1 Tax=Candidatus Dojkabacteria bacterium TaxID=2099670 RepID=A0A955L7R4_9BACT|nr:PIG-L family deacetylase [Candidatus Dojkabacteria bacterium]
MGITALITVFIIGIFVYLHDFSIQKFNEKIKLKNKRILFIYPHPDDETMISGGLLAYCASQSNVSVTCISTTKGENGTGKIVIPPDQLSTIRKIEFTNAMNALKVDNFELWDFPDGGIPKERKRLKNTLNSFLTKENFDYVVTYDESGLYGHPDHITLSEIIQELESLHSYKTIFATLTERMISRASLPTHMAEAKIPSPRIPNTRFNAWRYLFKRYKAAKAYKSQDLAQGIPLWFKLVVTGWEYYWVD